MSTTKKKPSVFYTYAYLRIDGTPYYIGKGKGKRAWSKHRKHIVVPKDHSRVLMLKTDLSEEDAFKHEVYMIAVFGRKDLGTGILHNRTNGGDGSSGHVPSIEVRLNHSKKMKQFHKDLSDERREEISVKRSKSLVEFYEQMPPDQKDKLFARFKGENNPMYGRTGEGHPLFGIKRPDHSLRMSGENNPMFGVRMFGENNPMFGTVGELCPTFGTKWWVNEKGENKRQKESPGADWQQGRKWKET
jgi:hypothetical protein